MTIRAGNLNGKNLNYTDNDNSAIDYALVNSGIIEGFSVTTGQVGVGRAILITKRTSVTPNQKFGIHIEITANEVIDTTGTKKVWVEVNPDYINDGALATVSTGTQIAKINTGVSYPGDSYYYIPLASITGGVITDERVMIKGKPVLRQGLANSIILGTDSSGNEGAVDIVPIIQATVSYVPNITAGVGYASQNISSGVLVMMEKNPICYGTTTQNLAYDTSNQKVCIYGYGNNTAFTTLSLGLYYNTAYGDLVLFRIETVDGSGNPTGTLFSANSYGSFASTDVYNVPRVGTCAGSVTIPAGQKVAVVISRTNVVSTTQYVKISSCGGTSNAYGIKTYNGTSWSALSTTAFGVLCTGFLSSVISPTYANATTPLGVTSSAVTIGSLASVGTAGLDSVSGATEGTMYKAGASGVLTSTTDITACSVIGIKNNVVEVVKRYKQSAISTISYVNPGGNPIGINQTMYFKNGGAFSFYVRRQSNDNQGYSIVTASSPDNSTWTTVSTISLPGLTTDVATYGVNNITPGLYYRVTSSGNTYFSYSFDFVNIV